MESSVGDGGRLMSTCTINVKLYGAFRAVSSQSLLNLEVELPIKVSTLKEILQTKIEQCVPENRDLKLLVNDAAVASDKMILHPMDEIREPVPLALLPPVCGG